jgi:hypothetical protein
MRSIESSLAEAIGSRALDALANWKETGRCKMEFALSQPPGMDDRKRTPDKSAAARDSTEPGWAEGLRQLYDSVVHEPLPDSFDDLLKKLDRAKNERD